MSSVLQDLTAQRDAVLAEHIAAECAHDIERALKTFRTRTTTCSHSPWTRPGPKRSAAFSQPYLRLFRISSSSRYVPITRSIQ